MEHTERYSFILAIYVMCPILMNESVYALGKFYQFEMTPYKLKSTFYNLSQN